MEISNYEKSRLLKGGYILLVILSIYFLMKTVSEIKNYSYIGGGTPATNIVTFNGTGEIFATPDMAAVSFTIRETGKDVKSAQSKVTNKESAALSFLKKSGVEEKDIKTENYNSNPQYNYNDPCYRGIGMPCSSSQPKIIGYEVTEYVTVKVRDLDKTGEIVQGLGLVGVSEMNGPNFSVENEEKLKAEARKIAIDDAKAKAVSLSKDLGVSLVRIVNFSENGNYPMPYAVEMQSAAKDGVASNVPPTLPEGENKIISNVTITYEIR